MKTTDFTRAKLGQETRKKQITNNLTNKHKTKRKQRGMKKEKKKKRKTVTNT